MQYIQMLGAIRARTEFISISGFVENQYLTNLFIKESGS